MGWYRTAVVLSLISTLFMLAGIHRLAMTLAGRSVALGAVLLAACNPLVVVQAHKASSDLVFAALATWTVAGALADDPSRRRLWLAVGVLAAAALLTRYVGGVLIVWAVMAWWWRTDGLSRRVRAATLGVLLGGILVVAGPWFAINLHQAGTPLATRNLENVAREYSGLSSGPDIVAHYCLNVGSRIAQMARTGMGIYLVFPALIGAVEQLIDFVTEPAPA